MTALFNLRKPITRTSLGESVYQHILEAILTGGLRGGTELSEVALAAELSVSRTPVHEALRRLTADGLVEQLPNRQARVAAFARQDIQEIYEMRIVLECAAIERAAKRLGDAQLAELRQEADAIAEAPSTARNWSMRAIDFDIQFHDTLAAAAGNSRLHAEITKVRHLVRAFCRMSGYPDNLRQAMEEHCRILAALEGRDAAGARRAMAAHVQSRLDAVLHEIDAAAAR
ncbi:MAG: GntR family transcriptional regulator [Gemmataceae bacterium]|nr:GntR family transcriptional regulator [Gemmataceae bacterium]